MKHQEFYRKYKTNYPPLEQAMFSKENWWRNLLVVCIAVLIEPLIIMYKHRRSDHFSLSSYVRITEYLLFIMIPFLGYLLWANWREWVTRRSGYGWFGRFEVISKRSSFIFFYLMLAPGNEHKLRIEKALFEKIRVGDFIQIRRNALGGLEEISKVKNYSKRLAKAQDKRLTNTARTG